MVYKTLANLGVQFRRGQLALVCGGPGTGKSGFSLNYALRARVPTLYLSADSDAYTQLSRSIAIATGKTLEEAEELILADDLSGVAEQLAGHPMRLNYSASPSLADIELSIESYEEVYGDYPALVVIDNVTNVRADMGEDGDPFSGLEGLMDYLHTMARETQACVLGLHHVTGTYNDAEKPIPMSGVKGQITRVPELVLTLHRPSPGSLGVSPVKNRGGKADASGNTFAELEFVGDKMLIRDYPVPVMMAPTFDEVEDDSDDEGDARRELMEMGLPL